MTGVLRQAQDERAGDPHPSPLPSRGRGCPSTGSGRTGGSPSPQPSPIEGEGMSFDRAQDEPGAVGAARLPRCCAPRNDRVLRQAQDERGVRPHPSPLPSRGRGCPSTGLRMNRGRWAQRDCRVAARLAMTGSFDSLRTNGRVTLTPALSHRGIGDVLRQAQDERGCG